VSAKSKNAVVPEDVGAVLIVSVLPPAEYPVLTTSFVVVYTVVVASNVAEGVYKAILKVCAEALASILTLNDVHIACKIAIFSLF
jgi:hypothetical protein